MVNVDGTMLIHYNDGDKEDDVKPRNVRRVGGGSSSKSGGTSPLSRRKPRSEVVQLLKAAVEGVPLTRVKRELASADSLDEGYVVDVGHGTLRRCDFTLSASQVHLGVRVPSRPAIREHSFPGA